MKRRYLKGLIWVLAVGVLVGCTSEKAKLEKLISSEIRDFPLKTLPSGSTVKEVSATVTAEAGLDFTGKAVVTVALPQLWSPLDTAASIPDTVRNDFEKNFRAALQAGQPEMPIPDGEFFNFYNSVVESLSPAFTEASPAGYTIRFTYTSIDGRKSGDSVRLGRVDLPQIDWGTKLTEDTKIVHQLPQGAKVYDSPEAFRDALLKAFPEQLASQTGAIQSRIIQSAAEKKKTLVGSWEGQAYQNIVDRAEFHLKIAFSSTGDCTGKLSVERVITGIGVSEINDDLDFRGKWRLSDSGIEVTATQTRWFHQGRQVQGPGSDKPGSAREDKLAAEPFVMKLSVSQDGDSLTWMPIGTKIESASGSEIAAMVPLSLRKTSQEEPVPAPVEPPKPSGTPMKLAPRPINSESAESPTSPAPEPESTGQASPQEETPEPSSGKFIKAPNLDDLPTFTVTTPSPGSAKLPPNPAEGERFPETRLRQLTVEDVATWNTTKIRYALNEMYARHGLTFKDKSTQAEFAKYKWYRPQPTRSAADIEAAFTEIEHANKELLAAARQVASNMDARGESGSPQQPEQKRNVKLPKTIYGPTDKFPDDIAGRGVAGRFLVVGTDMEGRFQLIARSDARNPFPRKFTITNSSIRDRPGVVLLIENYKPLDRSREVPFIILGKAPGMGVYLIKDPFLAD